MFENNIRFQSRSLDGRIDEVMPFIRHDSEDLYEEHFFATRGGKPWQEFRDDDTFLEKVKHYFMPTGIYYQSVNGNATSGTWEVLPDTNKLMLRLGDTKNPARIEFYDLVFLSEKFFIVKKDGIQERQKYLVMGFEPAVAGLAWQEYVELLYLTHAPHARVWWVIVLMVLVMGAILFLSF